MKYSIALLTLMLSSLVIAQESKQSGDVVLIVPDPDHPWAAAQIGGVLGDNVAYHEGSLLQAITLAQSGKAKGVVEIKLDTDAAWETGRVVCYAPSGKKLWEEKVFVNFGGGAEGVARKFADKLEKKVAGKHCSATATQ
jgi:hypothetical protein